VVFILKPKLQNIQTTILAFLCVDVNLGLEMEEQFKTT
jgi:hypothetical protein